MIAEVKRILLAEDNANDVELTMTALRENHVANEYQGRLKVAKMDVDHHQIVPQQYRVTSIPTLLIFKGGRVVSQLVGAMPRSKLEAEIQKHLG